MVVGEKQMSGAQGMSLEVVWRKSTSSREGIPKSETGEQSLLPVGRTSQQDLRSAVQLGHQQQLG